MDRPNIIFVITDDMSYGDLACTGNDIISTPNIDAFHADSVRFQDYHVGPTCSPTRAGLMTGHFANSTGVWHTIGGRSLLRKNEWTLAQALKEAGYATGMFGKWHLGDCTPFRPHERGFETAIYHGGGAIGNTPDGWGNDYFDDIYFVNGKETRFEGYCTDVWFDEGIKWITERSEEDKPFFCYLPTNAAHGPWNVEPKYSEPYIGKTDVEHRTRFFGMITNIDENFGRLRDAIQELGIEENTILVFMTDNGTWGGCMVDDDSFVTNGFNAGFRGRKGSEYEGGHRVPFFLRFPGYAKGSLDGGRDVDTLCANVDFMPTILDLAGVDVPHQRSFHGKSLKPVIDDAGASETEEWKDRILVTDSQRVVYPIKWRKSAAMKNKWRLINGEELYDVEADREQRDDVAADHPEILAELRAGYEAWWELLKPQYDLLCPAEIGGDEPTTVLTGHDIRNEESASVFTQGQVRQARAVNGYWEVNVVEAGKYRVELRRWPRGTTHPICCAPEKSEDVEWRSDIIVGEGKEYCGGVDMPVTQARLRIADIEATTSIAPEDKEVAIEMTLPRGVTRLEAQFSDGEDLALAPFYIYVERAD